MTNFYTQKAAPKTINIKGEIHANVGILTKIHLTNTKERLRFIACRLLSKTSIEGTGDENLTEKCTEDYTIKNFNGCYPIIFFIIGRCSTDYRGT